MSFSDNTPRHLRVLLALGMLAFLVTATTYALTGKVGGVGVGELPGQTMELSLKRP